MQSSGEPAVQPETSGPAPQPRKFAGLGIEFAQATDRRIKHLRRAAVIQIFELVGLGVVPGQFWQFLEHTPSPGDAVINFLAAIGVNPDLIRRSHSEEIERANEVLDLLVDIDGAFARLSDAARVDVQTAIFCGEYERVRESAQVVRTYASILALGDSYPDDQRFPAFYQFLCDVASELDSPLDASPSDAAVADRIRVNMSNLLRQLKDAREEQDRLIRLMWADFPTWQSSPIQADIALALSRFEAALESVLKRPNSVGHVGELLTHLDGFNVELRALLFELAGATRRKSSGTGSSRKGRSSGAYAKAGAGLLDRAMSYFGIRKSRLPSAADFKRLKRKFQMKTHPDTGGSNDQFLEFTTHCTIIEDYLAAA